MPTANILVSRNVLGLGCSLEKKWDLKADICDEVDSCLVPGEEIIDGVGEIADIDGPKPGCCFLLLVVGPNRANHVVSLACKV